MSIRDIIEKWHLISTNYARRGHSAVVRGRDFEEMRDDFASALEELSLMEAVCEAAEDDYMAEPHDDHERNRLATLNAVAALRAYRKERGL